MDADQTAWDVDYAAAQARYNDDAKARAFANFKAKKRGGTVRMGGMPEAAMQAPAIRQPPVDVSVSGGVKAIGKAAGEGIIAGIEAAPGVVSASRSAANKATSISRQLADYAVREVREPGVAAMGREVQAKGITGPRSPWEELAARAKQESAPTTTDTPPSR